MSDGTRAAFAETNRRLSENNELRAAIAELGDDVFGAADRLSAPPAEEVEAVAMAINDARYGPDYPPKMKRTFDEADRSDREYSLRLSRAAISALNAHRSAHQAIPSGLAEEFELLCKRVKKFEEDHGPCSLRDDLALLCLDNAAAIRDALRALTPSSAEKPNNPGETKNSP